jgi:hypothetical protein
MPTHVNPAGFPRPHWTAHDVDTSNILKDEVKDWLRNLVARYDTGDS